MVERSAEDDGTGDEWMEAGQSTLESEPCEGVEEHASFSKQCGLWCGPLLACAAWGTLALVKPTDMSEPARRLAAMTVWMAVWWMTEAVPLGVTALLPLAAFPVLQIAKSPSVAKNYSANIIWLFFGGFQLAFALERAGLHRRIAFSVIRAIGTRLAFLLFGIMIVVGALSMFISNTSTTLMVLPIAQAMASSLEVEGELKTGLGKGLMLGVAYSASMGGLGCLIGTPPNGVLVGQAEIFGFHISFAQWFAFAAPLSILMILALWVYLLLRFRIPFARLPPTHPVFSSIREGLGPISTHELRVGLVFALTVMAWCARKPVGDATGLEKGVLGDDTIAILVTIALFLIPSGDTRPGMKHLMTWEALLKTPWHILLLFGGGLALASAFKDTGLSAWLGKQLSWLSNMPIAFAVFFVVLLMTFLTELTSNTATATVLLPIIGEVARAIGVSPATLMVPATLAASCAFMLPVATPPNAVVYASGLITIRDMASTGLVINLATAVLITCWMLSWGNLFFNI